MRPFIGSAYRSPGCFGEVGPNGTDPSLIDVELVFHDVMFSVQIPAIFCEIKGVIRELQMVR